MISRASGIHWSKQPFANANSGNTTRRPGKEQRIALPLPRGVVSPTFSRWVSCFAGSISRDASALAAASVTASFCHKIPPELDYLNNTANYRSERERIGFQKKAWLSLVTQSPESWRTQSFSSALVMKLPSLSTMIGVPSTHSGQFSDTQVRVAHSQMS